MGFNANIPLANELISNSQGDLFNNNQFLGSTAGNSANGYYKLPNGLIINWGTLAFTTAGTKTISYQQAYSSVVYVVEFSLSFSSSGNIVPVCIDATTTPASLASAKFRVNTNVTGGDTGTIFMVAIGV